MTKKKLSFDEEKASSLLSELIETFQKHRPTTSEIIVVSSNLLYALGASIGNYDEKGPGLEELKKIHYENPERIDISFMLQGLTMSVWYNDYQKLMLEKESKD